MKTNVGHYKLKPML